MEKNLLILILFTVLMPKTESLVAFDCETSLINKTSISLIETIPCEKDNRHKIESSVSIQVIQPKQYEEVNVRSCLIEIEHLISRCGKSFLEPVAGGLYTEILKMNDFECSKLHNTGVLNYPGGPLIQIDPQLNIQSISQKTWGVFGTNGDCVPGQSLFINGLFFDRPVRTSSFKIRLQETKASFKVDEDNINLVDGTTCKYTDFNCFSLSLGYSFWSPIMSAKTCLEIGATTEMKKHISIYSGPAVKITETINNISTITYMVDNEKYTFAFTEKRKYKSCGVEFIQTEHPKLSIIDYENSAAFLFPIEKNLNPKEMSLTNYVNSKLIFTVSHIKSQMENLYEAISSARCEHEQQTIRNLQGIGMISPEAFAYAYMKQPGYISNRAGEVIHLGSCKAVSVKFRKINNTCFNELPVLLGERALFMHPNTRILTSIGTEIECNSFAPPMFKLSGNWYSVRWGKELHLSPPPTILGPKEQLTWQFQDMQNLAQSGLYTSEDIDNLQKLLLTPLTTKSLTVAVTKSIVGDSHLPEGANIYNALKPYDIEEIKNQVTSFWEKFINSMGIFGQTMSALIGIIVIFKLIAFIFNLLLNWLILGRENRSCLIYLFLWWDRLIDYIIKRNIITQRDNKKGYNERDEDVELSEVITKGIYPTVPTFQELKG